jgi:hypothetical protein
MADTEVPEGTKGKRDGKGLFGGASKLPMDGIILVVVPFVAFLILFLYVMGLVPPGAVTVQVIAEETSTEPEVVSVPGRGGIAQAVESGGTYPATDSTAAEPNLSAPQSAEVATDSAGAGSEAAAVALPMTAEPQSVATGQDGTVSEDDQDEKMRQLARVYEQMKASSVAAILQTMSDAEAIGILSNMKPRSAAKVLASLDPERAASISMRLTQ